MSAIAVLAARFHDRVERALTAALAARIGDDPTWDAFLAAEGERALPVAERLALAAQGVPNLRGALPVEVRRLLERIGSETERQLAAIPQDDESDAARDRLRQELTQFVAQKMRDYLDRARPAPTLAGIFANAQATSLRSGDVKAGTETVTCPCCGAARQKGGSLKICAYCGNELFLLA
jgi:hypothetical protein